MLQQACDAPADPLGLFVKTAGDSGERDVHAILGCLLAEDRTTPPVVEMVITPYGHML